MADDDTFENWQGKDLNFTEGTDREIGYLGKAVGHGATIGKAGAIFCKPVDIVLAKLHRPLYEPATSFGILLCHKTSVNHPIGHHDKGIIVILVPAVAVMIPTAVVIVSINAGKSLLHSLLVVGSVQLVQGDVRYNIKELPITGAAFMPIDLPHPVHKMIFCRL